MKDIPDSIAGFIRFINLKSLRARTLEAYLSWVTRNAKRGSSAPPLNPSSPACAISSACPPHLPCPPRSRPSSSAPAAGSPCVSSDASSRCPSGEPCLAPATPTVDHPQRTHEPTCAPRLPPAEPSPIDGREVHGIEAKNKAKPPLQPTPIRIEEPQSKPLHLPTRTHRIEDPH